MGRHAFYSRVKQEIGLKEMMCLESCHSGFGQFETIVRWMYSPFHLTESKRLSLSMNENEATHFIMAPFILHNNNKCKWEGKPGNDTNEHQMPLSHPLRVRNTHATNIETGIVFP